MAEFLAVGKRSAFRSLPGAKLQAAENQRKSVLVFAHRVRRERVRLLCLVCVGVGASLRRWFAWASARSLRQNWRWLKLVRTQNRGRAAARNLGPRFLLATKSGSAPRTCNWPRRKAQPEGLWRCCCLECLRATPLSIAILESFKPVALDQALPDGR